MIGATVVGKAAATVITSSPFLILLSPSSGDVNAINARRLADEPEFVKEQCLTPRNFAKSFSNFSAYLPVVSQKSREESTRLAISFSSNTRPAYGIRSPGVKTLFFLCLTSKCLTAETIVNSRTTFSRKASATAVISFKIISFDKRYFLSRCRIDENGSFFETITSSVKSIVLPYERDCFVVMNRNSISPQISGSETASAGRAFSPLKSVNGNGSLKILPLYVIPHVLSFRGK